MEFDRRQTKALQTTQCGRPDITSSYWNPKDGLILKRLAYVEVMAKID
jgi:hypothetical protein